MEAPNPGPLRPVAPGVASKGKASGHDEDPPRSATGKVEFIVSVLLVTTPFLLFGLFMLLDRIFS